MNTSRTMRVAVAAKVWQLCKYGAYGFDPRARGWLPASWTPSRLRYGILERALTMYVNDNAIDYRQLARMLQRSAPMPMRFTRWFWRIDIERKLNAIIASARDFTPWM